METLTNSIEVFTIPDGFEDYEYFKFCVHKKYFFSVSLCHFRLTTFTTSHYLIINVLTSVMLRMLQNFVFFSQLSATFSTFSLLYFIKNQYFKYVENVVILFLLRQLNLKIIFLKWVAGKKSKFYIFVGFRIEI